jgi:hypothetical protein
MISGSTNHFIATKEGALPMHVEQKTVTTVTTPKTKVLFIAFGIVGLVITCIVNFA